MPGLAASDNSPPTAAPPPRRLSSPLPRRAPPSPSPSASSRAKPRKPSPSPTAFPADADDSLDNPDLGPFLLKQARDAMVSGEGGGAARALEFAERAARALERRGEGAELELAMSLHVAAAIHCGLGRHADAIPVLERAVAVVTPPAPAAKGEGEGEGEDGAAAAGGDEQQQQRAEPDQRGEEWSLAAFSGWMQLGDTHAMLGRMDESIACYGKGLEIQMAALGERDPRVAETCRYLAEAHVQALQFDEAEKLCRKALEIHREHSAPASLEEASDRRLMALILDAKGDYDGALEHLVLASMTMVANGRDVEVATIDIAIGNTYLALARFDEAVFSYQKALTVLKSARGDDHPTVAPVSRPALLTFTTEQAGCASLNRTARTPCVSMPSRACNLAAIYDAMGRVEDAIEILEHVLKVREEKLGTANPDVEDEKKRLAELLKEAGRSRNRKQKSLENLFVTNSQRAKKEAGRRWSNFGFRS
ncbi:unnamed protein product [Miscanthus lutarioriparius]|uniref:Uncharacterized protein n=1 Tax=Miscanthus lutarioriparius TaxID=422564 RepID=A0A811PY41_9POAL|nr:unnamed protein product [Miscanthus lutarioriparius]